MARKKMLYRCRICGNIVEVLHEGSGELYCCGEIMQSLNENIIDASTEKHIPIIEKKENGILVKVGSEAHPMEKDHYIEWIEIHYNNKTYRQYLKAGDKAEAFFLLDDPNTEIIAKAFCNKHGLWKNK